MQEKLTHVLEQIKSSCIRIFSDNLVGIYIHGSLSLGCFNWDKSDIDFIVVTESAPSPAEKEAFIRDLLAIDTLCPPKGLEMSIVLKKHTRNFSYPTPYELHFSNDHKKNFRNHPAEYCGVMHGLDQDLAAHFTVIRKAGMVLYGEAIEDIFQEVPKADYLDSIREDVKNAGEDIFQNPIYIILNLCRILAYIKEGLVLSKADGGSWALHRVPESYQDIICQALGCYGSGKTFPAHMDHSLLKEFAEYMLKLIFKET